MGWEESTFSRGEWAEDEKNPLRRKEIGIME
jgi:hypothetical protein